MAEGWVKRQLAEAAPQAQVHSAGIKALVDYPSAEEAQAVMLQEGIDISSHRARQLTREMIADADLILTMEKHQIREISRLMPQARGKTFLLGKWSDFEIDDPYRQAKPAFENVLFLIKEGWQEWAKRL